MVEVKILVPVKDYVKQYLINKYGNEPLITRRDNIGKSFYNLLEKTISKHDTMYKGYGSLINIRIGEDVLLRAGCFLRPAYITEFNNVVAEEVKGDMRIFIRMHQEFKPEVQLRHVVELYYERFGFDENTFKTDTILKDYYRWRKSAVGFGTVNEDINKSMTKLSYKKTGNKGFEKQKFA